MKRRTPAKVTRSMTELGHHIAGWRKVQNLPASLVAERAGISRTTLTRVESGDPGVQLDTLMRVLNVLGIMGEVVDSLDPLKTELGRARAHMLTRQRVRS